MSTYFDIACVDCAALMGVRDGNHLEELLQAVLNQQTHWEAIAFHAVEAGGFVDLEIHLAGRKLSIDFFSEHTGHRLAVKCEYETFPQLEQRLDARQTYWERERHRK